MDKHSRIFFSLSTNKIYEYDTKTEILSRVFPPKLLSDYITQVRCFKNKWYIGTRKGLSIFDGLGWNWFPGEEVLDIAIGPDDDIYSLTTSNLSIIYNERYSENIEFPSQVSNPHRIAVDNNDDVWITSDTILAKYSGGFWYTHGAKQGLSGKLKSIVFDGENIWIGGICKLFKWNGWEWEKINFSPNLVANSAEDMTPDGKGGLVIGTDTGILHFSNGTFRPLLKNTITSLLRVGKGLNNNVWYQIGLTAIEMVNLENGTVTDFSSSFPYLDIEELTKGYFDLDSRGNLMIGGSGGLRYYRFFIQTKEPTKTRKSKPFIKRRTVTTVKRKGKQKIDVAVYPGKRERDVTHQYSSIEQAFSGDIVWKTQTRAMPCIKVPPLISDKYLINQDYEGWLSCFSLENGNLIWRNKISSEEPTLAPLASQNKVIVSNGNIKVLDINNGKLIKSLPIKACAMNTTKSEISLLTKDSVIIFDAYNLERKKTFPVRKRGRSDQWMFQRDDKIWIFGVNSWNCYGENGKPIWESIGYKQSRSPILSAIASPSFFEDTVYYPSFGELFIIDATTGKCVNELRINEIIHYKPAITEEYILFATKGFGIHCLDRRGEVNWKVKCANSITPVTSVSNTIYFSPKHTIIKAVNAGNGFERWNCDLKGNGTPYFLGISDELLIAITSRGEFYGIKR